MRQPPLIGIVGPCASGKSTLTANLKRLGYRARPIAQEHSLAPNMWQRLTKPDVLIVLDVSFAEAQRRRKMQWREEDYREQHRRLAHARAHADFYLHTDGLTPQEVAERVIAFLNSVGVTSQNPTE